MLGSGKRAAAIWTITGFHARGKDDSRGAHRSWQMTWPRTATHDSSHNSYVRTNHMVSKSTTLETNPAVPRHVEKMENLENTRRSNKECSQEGETWSAICRRCGQWRQRRKGIFQMLRPHGDLKL